MELLWFILASYGLTFLVVYASIFNRIRPSKDGFGALENYSTVLCVLVSIQVGFYLPLTSGQNYLLLTIP